MDKKKTNDIKDRQFVSFAGLNPYIEDNIVRNTEKEVRGQGWIEFGTENKYPSYIYSLYESVPVLQSIINGVCDYAVGDGVKSLVAGLSDEDAERLVRQMAMSYIIFGSVSLNVLRNRMGTVAKVLSLDTRNVRSDENNNNFYYSKDFSNNKSYGRCKALVYPAFNAEAKDIATSVYYHKNAYYTTYGQPIWGSAVKSAETAKEIQNFNLNAIKNGLSANVMVSFCNGQPSDEIREEIEDMFEQKFQGTENAGRPMISFCQDKDHSVQVDKIDADSFADRYTNLKKSVEQELYTAFRATPCLFGLNSDNKGFSEEEYDEAFKLFNKTVVKPIQKIIVNILHNIYGQDAIEIQPFSIDWSENSKEKTVE